MNVSVLEALNTKYSDIDAKITEYTIRDYNLFPIIRRMKFYMGVDVSGLLEAIYVEQPNYVVADSRFFDYLIEYSGFTINDTESAALTGVWGTYRNIKFYAYTLSIEDTKGKFLLYKDTVTNNSSILVEL